MRGPTWRGVAYASGACGPRRRRAPGGSTGPRLCLHVPAAHVRSSSLGTTVGLGRLVCAAAVPHQLPLQRLEDRRTRRHPSGSGTSTSKLLLSEGPGTSTPRTTASTSSAKATEDASGRKSLTSTTSKWRAGPPHRLPSRSWPPRPKSKPISMQVTCGGPGGMIGPLSRATKPGDTRASASPLCLPSSEMQPVLRDASGLAGNGDGDRRV